MPPSDISAATMETLKRRLVAEEALARLLWAEPEFWQHMRTTESARRMFNRGGAFDAAAWVNDALLAMPDSPELNRHRWLIERFAQQAGGVPTTVAALGDHFLDDAQARIALFHAVDDMALSMACVDVDQILLNWDVASPGLLQPLEVYLTQVIQHVLGRPLTFPERYVVPLIKLPPGTESTFTFSAPTLLNVADFEKLIDDWTRTVKRDLRNTYITSVLGRDVAKMKETISRNVRWLYDARVRQIPIIQISREYFRDRRRRTEVRDGIRQVRQLLSEQPEGI
jgi:hypothetical protein